MSDDHFDIHTPGEDADLEQMLTTLGPTALSQEWAESQGPTPEFAESLRRRMVGKPKMSRRSRIFAWTGALGGVAVAAIIVVLALTLRGSGTGTPPHTAFALPTPGRADLSKSYPLEGGRGGGGLISPTRSNIEIPSGDVYDGHVTLVGQPTGGLPTRAGAYALEQTPRPFSPYVVSLARRLGIPGKPVLAHDYLHVFGRPRLSTFVYVKQGTGLNPASPLRSVAVAPFNGEVIFHDTTYALRARPGKPQTVAAAVAAGRAWLDHLGWPGESMPVVGVGPLFAPLRTATGSTRQISFGWPGIRRTDQPAAVLLVNRNGGVSEALIEPMISRKETVTLRPVTGAWKLVQKNLVPIGVNVIIVKRNVPAAGRLQATDIEEVFTTTPSGAVYLIPSYSFSGTVQIRGRRGRFGWVALVPGVK